MLNSIRCLKLTGFSILFFLFILTGCATAPEKPSGEVTLPAEKTEETPPVETPEEEADLLEKLEAVASPENTGEALAVFEESSDELSIEEKIVMASLQVAEGLFPDAEATLDEVLAEEPENTEALYVYALLYDAREEEPLRDDTLKKTLALDPGHIDANLFQGMVRLGRRDYRNAGANFSLVLQEEPENFLALSGAATAQMNQDNLESAVSLLDRAIELEPDFAYLYIDRARAWKGLKKYGKSEDDITRAIELEPDVEWHYLDRARIRIQYFYNLEGAYEDLSKLLSINPENFFGNVYMAGILDDWKRYDEAEAAYLKVLKARPSYGFAHEPLAKIAYMNERYEDAAEHFIRAYDFEPREFCYILSAAVCMEKYGDRSSAQSLLKEVAPRVQRETVMYEMFRYYLSPGSDFFISDKIQKEEDKEVQSRMYFYLGARYDLAGLRNSALAAYGNVNEKSDFYESDLAGWELNRAEN